MFSLNAGLILFFPWQPPRYSMSSQLCNPSIDAHNVQSAGNGDREEERSSVYLKVTNMGQALWSKDLDFLQGLHIWAFLAWFEK